MRMYPHIKDSGTDCRSVSIYLICANLVIHPINILPNLTSKSDVTYSKLSVCLHMHIYMYIFKYIYIYMYRATPLQWVLSKLGDIQALVISPT